MMSTMTDEEAKLVRTVVGYVRKMVVEGLDPSGGVRVGRVLAAPVHLEAQKAADELFRRMRAP